MLTLERLREVLNYDPASGIFTWRISSNRKFKIGDIAGGLDEKGYIRIKIDGKKYRAHRLAWFGMTGVWPIEVDHKDLNKANNIWTNLREATRVQNTSNGKVRNTNKLGVKGIYKKNNKFVAEIVANKIRYDLGSYNTLEEAKEAYQQGALKHHGEFARND